MEPEEIAESTTATMSTVASLFIITVSLTSEFLRKGYPYKYIFILSVLDLIWESNRIIPPTLIKSQNFCLFQACINEIFHLSSILWTGVMSLEMYNVTILNKKQENFGFYKPLIAIIISSSLSCIPLILLKKFDISKGYCWINVNSSPFETCLYRLFFFYLFAWICIFWNIFVAVKARKELKIKFGREDHVTIRQLKMYPFVLMVCYIPKTFYRFLDPWNLLPSWLSCLMITIGNLEGFFNFLVFGFNQDVRNHLKKCSKKQVSNHVSLV